MCLTYVLWEIPFQAFTAKLISQQSVLGTTTKNRVSKCDSIKCLTTLKNIYLLNLKLTHIVKWKGGRVSSFSDESFDADLSFLLLSEGGRGQDLVDHSRTLSPSEERVQILASQKPEGFVLLTSRYLFVAFSGSVVHPWICCHVFKPNWKLVTVSTHCKSNIWIQTL